MGSYALSPTSALPFIEINMLGNYLSDFGFYELDLSRKGKIIGSYTDQIFFRNSKERVSLVLDLKYRSSPSQKEYGVLRLQIENPNGNSASDFVCHAKINKRNVALLFENISEKEVHQICSNLNKTIVSHNQKLNNKWNTIASSLFYSEANAQCIEPNQGAFAGIHKHISESQILQQMGTCLSRAKDGAVETTKSYANSIALLLTSPTEFWGEIKKSSEAIMNLVVNFKQEMNTLVTSLNSLDRELLVESICPIIGSVVAGIAISSVTAAGVAKVAESLMQALIKLKSSQFMFGRLNQLKQSGRAPLAQEILICAVR